MRYDTKLVFIVGNGGYYNPDKGEHVDNEKVETIKYANVTDLGTDRSKVLFGDIQQGAKVIRLLRPYKKAWDYVLIVDELKQKTRKYEIITERNLRSKNTFIVQEVAKDG